MATIVFAALSVFIFLKLRSQLGKISDEDKQRLENKAKADREKIIALQKQITDSINTAVTHSVEEHSKINEKILGHLPSTTQEHLKDIFTRCKITPEFFINGVRSCFEMILKAFASKDLDTLKFLLSEKIYAGFENAINQRNMQEKILHSNIIVIEKSDILSAQIVDNEAFVTIEIHSKQINYFTNKEEKIIEGKKDDIAAMIDIWTFKKDLTSPNPNWIVTATK